MYAVPALRRGQYPSAFYRFRRHSVISHTWRLPSLVRRFLGSHRVEHRRYNLPPQGRQIRSRTMPYRICPSVVAGVTFGVLPSHRFMRDFFAYSGFGMVRFLLHHSTISGVGFSTVSVFETSISISSTTFPAAFHTLECPSDSELTSHRREPPLKSEES